MDETSAPHPTDRTTLTLRWILGLVLAVLLLGAAAVAYAYFTTPATLRRPASAHYHFRMQIIVDGQPVNFADTKYQTEFNKDICTAKLTKEPFHFHDKLNQFTHVHWGYLTGGLVLKNYGWNLIGGSANTLGYRFDRLPRVTRIPIHGPNLPAVPPHTRYFIYTGDETGYRQADWSKFLRHDLETFFHKDVSSRGWLSTFLAPTASAHSSGAGNIGHEEERTKLNHVLGNVVIFAQTDPPASAEITARFADLVPLPESACGG